MKPHVDYRLYLVTDRELMTANTVEESVLKAIEGGCTVVQLREKELDSRAFYETAAKVKAVCDHYQIPLIINDRVDIALAVDAAGVHLGQQDLPAKRVRELLPAGKLIGVSVATVDEAKKAIADTADYLGVGAMFATSTKVNTRPVSLETLSAITANVDVPVVAIGGIHAGNVKDFAGTGIAGVAVVSAIVGKHDITAAAQTLLEEVNQITGLKGQADENI